MGANMLFVAPCRPRAERGTLTPFDDGRKHRGAGIKSAMQNTWSKIQPRPGANQMSLNDRNNGVGNTCAPDGCPTENRAITDHDELY